MEQANLDARAISNASSEEILTVIADQDAYVARAVASCISQISHLVDAMTHALSNGGRIFYCGCGTSIRLVLSEMAEFSLIGKQANEAFVVVALADGLEDSAKQGIIAYENADCKAADVVIGISDLGSELSTLAFMAQAKKDKCVVAAISNQTDTPMTSLANIAIEVPIRSDVVTSFSYATQKMILGMLTAALHIKMGGERSERNPQLAARKASILYYEH